MKVDGEHLRFQKIRKIYFKIQLQINTKCDSIEQDEKREKEGEKSARNRAKT